MGISSNKHILVAQLILTSPMHTWASTKQIPQQLSPVAERSNMELPAKSTVIPLPDHLCYSSAGQGPDACALLINNSSREIKSFFSPPSNPVYGAALPTGMLKVLGWGHARRALVQAGWCWVQAGPSWVQEVPPFTGTAAAPGTNQR